MKISVTTSSCSSGLLLLLVTIWTYLHRPIEANTHEWIEQEKIDWSTFVSSETLSQYQVLCMLATTLTTSNTTTTWQCDMDALLPLTPPCSTRWQGVNCTDIYGNITSLYLPDVISGSLPNELFTLTSLQSLFIEADALDGSISSDINSLIQLETLYIHTKYELIVPFYSIGMMLSLREIDLQSADQRLALPPWDSIFSSFTQLESIRLSGLVNSLSFVAPSSLKRLELIGDFHYLKDDIFRNIGSTLEQLIIHNPSLIKRKGGDQEVVFIYALPSTLMSTCNALQVLEVYSELQYIPSELTLNCIQLTTLSLQTFNLTYDSSQDVNSIVNFATLTMLQSFALEVIETSGYFPKTVLSIPSLTSLTYSGTNYTVPTGLFDQITSLQTLSLTGNILNTTTEAATIFANCPMTLKTLQLINTTEFMPSLSALQQCVSLQSLQIHNSFPAYELVGLFDISLNLTTLSISNFNERHAQNVKVASMPMKHLKIGDNIWIDKTTAVDNAAFVCNLHTFTSNTTLTSIPSFLRYCDQLTNISLVLDCGNALSSSSVLLSNTAFQSWQDVFPQTSLQFLSLEFVNCPNIPFWLWTTSATSAKTENWKLEEVSLTFYELQTIHANVTDLFNDQTQAFSKLAFYGNFTSVPSMPFTAINSLTIYSLGAIKFNVDQVVNIYTQLQSLSIYANQISIVDITNPAGAISALVNQQRLVSFSLQSVSKPLPPLLDHWNASFCLLTSLESVSLISPALTYSNVYSEVKILNRIHACVATMPKLRSLHLEGFELVTNDTLTTTSSHIRDLIFVGDLADLNFGRFLDFQQYVRYLEISRVFSSSYLTSGATSVPSFSFTLSNNVYLFFTKSMNVTGFIIDGALSDMVLWHGMDLDLIYLPSHQLSYSFPNDILATSNMIVVNNNKLEGALEIPSYIVITATYIDLSNNKLSGIFPLGFFRQYYTFGDNSVVDESLVQQIILIPPIEYLNFQHNSILGAVPDNLFILPSEINLNPDTIKNRALNVIHPLNSFLFGHNLLGASFTGIFSNCVDYTHDLLSLEVFSGPFSNVYGMFDLSFLPFIPSLKTLNLSSNSLTGTLPTSIDFYSLETLDLSSNILSGNFSSSSYLLPSTQSNLKYLRLNNNKFDGYFEDITWTTWSPSDVIAMKDLNLAYNSLKGKIQLGDWSRFTSLQVLSLSNNELTGSIPCIQGIYLFLDLSYNQLSGSMPYCLFSSNLYVDLRANQLEYKIPKSVCLYNSPLIALYLASNSEITCYPSCIKVMQNDFISTNLLEHCPDDQDIALCRMVERNWVQQSLQLNSLLLPIDFSNTGDDTKQFYTVAQSNAISYSIEIISGFTNCPAYLTPTLSICVDSACSTVLTNMNLGKGSTLNIPYSSFTLFYKQSTFCFYFATLKITSRKETVTGWNCKTKSIRVPINSTGPYSAIRRRQLVSRPAPSITPTMQPTTITPTSSPTIQLYKDVELPYAVSACTWTGVDCTNHPGRKDGSITSLSLKAMSIEDRLFGNEFEGFDSLEILDLSYNKFYGMIPSDFGAMSEQITSLDFTSNSFTGIGLNISKFSKLSVLKIGSNALNGTLSSDFITQAATKSSLSYLELYSNQYEGLVPSAFCQPNISIILTRNTQLTCIELQTANNVTCGNLDLIESNDIYPCAPTITPTLVPTHFPTLRGIPLDVPQSTSSAWKEEYTIIIAVVLGVSLLILLISGFFLFKQRHTKPTDLITLARLELLEVLPLHKMVVENTTITAADVILHRDTFKKLDYDGYMVLDLVLANIAKCALDDDAFYALVSYHLPINLETNEPQEKEYGWSKVIMLEDEKVLRVVNRILSTYPQHSKLLAYGKNNKGRSNIDMASVPCYQLIQQYLFLHKQYQLFPTSEHVSDTCEVYFAHHFPPKKNGFMELLNQIGDSLEDMANNPFLKGPSMVASSLSSTFISSLSQVKVLPNNDNGTEEEQHIFATSKKKPSSSKKVAEVKENEEEGKLVVLKFIRSKKHFERELNIRLQQNINDARYTVTLLKYYDGDNVTDEDQIAFRQDAVIKGFATFPYCLILQAAEQNLKRYIDRSNIAGKEIEEVIRISKHILSSLHFLHEQGVVHGDLKPTNIVKVDTNFKIIDFDASANMFQEEYLGNKVSTLYCPPEMFYLSEPSDGGESTVAIRWNYQDQDQDQDQNNDKEFKSPRSEIAMDIEMLPYQRVIASTKHDMWSFGVLLYFLVTGSPLFLSTTDDNIALPKDLMKLYQWTDEIKNAKLASLSFTTNTIFKGNSKKVVRLRNLLSYLLHKEIHKRLTASQVLLHPFFTDKEHIRLAGEETAEFDCFLSYRVASDSKHVLYLYEQLTKRGIKVWLDKYCLESGKNWEQGFCEGLVKSAHFISLISRNAINHPTIPNMNFTSFTSTSSCDNVFLEWRLALELLDRDLLQGIFPVFIGDIINETTQEYGNYFGGKCFPARLQNINIQRVEDKVMYHLDNAGLGHPYRIEEDATVSKTFNDITANQGAFVEGLYEQAMTGIVNKIVEMIHNSKLRSSTKSKHLEENSNRNQSQI